MAWQNPITTWGQAGQTVPGAADFNRIEGNIQYLQDTKETPSGAQAKVDTHANLTSAHSATSAATANRIMMRDANGRAKVMPPSKPDDIATKSTVDTVQTNLTTHTNITDGAHGATYAPLNNRIIQRDANGRAKVAAPSASDDIARKQEVDTVQTNLNTHTSLVANAHGSTEYATAYRIIQRDGNGRAKIAIPVASDDIARKDTVDTHAAQIANINTLGHIKHAVLTATLDTTWAGTSAPYSKTVTVGGILATDTPIIDVVMSGTYATDDARSKAWGHIYRAVTSDNSITFYAKNKPTVELPIQIRVVR